MAPRTYHYVAVTLTDEATEALAVLAPPKFGPTAESVASEWLARWCRGHYFIEPLDPPFTGGPSSLVVPVNAATRKGLLEAGNAAGLTVEETAATIINKRARRLYEAKRRNKLF